MNFFWTSEADAQYVKYQADPPVQQTFRDLVSLIEQKPDAGWRIEDIVQQLEDPAAKRIARALKAQQLPSPARIVVATIPRPRRAMPPPWLALVVHLSGAPPSTKAQHTLLTMGTISRQPDARFR